jgi:glycosyltransferase involved in cell wall biosynthesis
MSNEPCVSIIIPTKNSSKYIKRCLESITNQTHKNIEIIVVDNFSSDTTTSIAKEFTSKIYLHGPERSAQVNFGVLKSTGQYVYKVDSDFVLDPNVVSECVNKIEEGFDAIVVHNTPDITVSWIAKIRKFETDMYKYNITYSSARFIKRGVFDAIGGFNENITAGEDYDFQNRINLYNFNTGFIDAEALHLGESKSIGSHLIKYYDYGKDLVNFSALNKKEKNKQLTPFRSVYFNNINNFINNPFTGLIFIGYTFCKFLVGGIGFFIAKISNYNLFLKIRH